MRQHTDSKLETLYRVFSEGQSKLAAEIVGQEEKLKDHTKHVVAVMEKVVEVVGIPKGDTPTVEELLAEARTDPVRRKLVEDAMSELEFADTEIQFP